MSDVLASDGLIARPVKWWAKDKLHYVRRYIDIFTTGMKDSWPRLVYIDLFSGPGRSVVHPAGEELPGTPMVAADAKYPFHSMYLNDLDKVYTDALRQRLRNHGTTRAIVESRDCNEAAAEARGHLTSGPEAGRTLGLAVIDPTAFQISFDSIAAMTRGVRVDLIVTLMTGYLRRFIDEPSFEPRLDPFFGSRDWREFVDLRAKGKRITYRALLDYYEAKLKGIGYPHVDDHVRILNSKEQTIYHLVFASKHPRGKEFFAKIRQQGAQGQLSMFDE